MFALIVDDEDDYAVLDLNSLYFNWIMLDEEPQNTDDWCPSHRFPSEAKKFKYVNIFKSVKEARESLSMLVLLELLEEYKYCESIKIFHSSDMTILGLSDEMKEIMESM